MKIKHEKIFCGPSKMLENISCPIKLYLKYLMTSTKTLRAPSYILNVRFLSQQIHYLHSKIHCKVDESLFASVFTLNNLFCDSATFLPQNPFLFLCLFVENSTLSQFIFHHFLFTTTLSEMSHHQGFRHKKIFNLSLLPKMSWEQIPTMVQDFKCHKIPTPTSE